LYDRRIYCNYLNKLCIIPNGDVIQCAHDFEYKNIWGNILEDKIFDILLNNAREQKKEEHCRGEFFDLCGKCNYNRDEERFTKYIWN